ncbi:MAG: DUF4159 domain-containing protein [Candidatus Latescibacterota bacterium]|nr:DUF4159 domain-containing protein [Candidatus Latescibacterota bacterium]
MKLLFCTAVALCLASQAPAQPSNSEDGDQEEKRPEVRVPEPTRRSLSMTTTHTVISVRYPLAREGVDVFASALPELIAFANEQRPVNARFLERAARLIDPVSTDALLLYLTGNATPLGLSQAEKNHLGKLLRSGGLLYAEDVRPHGGHGFQGEGLGIAGTPFDRQLKALIAESAVLGDAGRAWRRVPTSHPIYSTLFNFPDGPPLISAIGANPLADRVTELEMIEDRGRVAVLFSELNISYAWAFPDAPGSTQSLRFGTNLLVFAMVQQAATRLQSR